MQSATESLRNIIDDMKRMKGLEAKESALSSNKGYVGAQHGKRVKRGPQTHLPTEGGIPETTFTRSERTLHAVSRVFKARRHDAEMLLAYGSVGKLPPKGSVEWEERRKAVLGETDVSPVEVAFLYGYTDSKSVRELRIRHGKNEHTGRLLKDDERPLISSRARSRRP